LRGSPSCFRSVIAAGFGLACVLSSPQHAGAQAPPGDSLRLVGDMVLDARAARGADGRQDLASPSGHIGLDGAYAAPWPNGRVPVAFDSSISPAQQAMFFDICSRWSGVANVRCAPVDGDVEYLLVRSGGTFGGCNSVVGYSPFYREMNLDPECWHGSVVLHEIGHAFGLDHEHQRLDRDLFVAIDLDNVTPAFTFAYNLGFGTSTGPYDLRSVMHYPWYGFAVDATRPAIVPRGAQASRVYEMGMGRRVGSETFPSDGDAAVLRSLYGASDAVPHGPATLRLLAASGNALSIAWDAPRAGPPVRQYRIEASRDAAFIELIGVVRVAASVTSLSGVLPSGEYHIRIVPVGELGDGAASKTLSVSMPGGTVIEPPGAPTLSAVQAGTNPITLSWTPGAGGPPTSYTIVAGRSPLSSDFGIFPMNRATSVTGAVPLDVPIYVRVVAANAAGTAVSSLLTVTVPSNPRQNRR
jgi:Astacin (Peptidase family M12A)